MHVVAQANIRLCCFPLVGAWFFVFFLIHFSLVYDAKELRLNKLS